MNILYYMLNYGKIVMQNNQYCGYSENIKIKER